MTTLREISEKRAALVAQLHGLTDNKPGLTAEERTQADAWLAEIEALDGDRARGEKIAALEAHSKRSNPNIGMSRDEVQRYSLLRAINAAATRDWRGAELELEASAAVAKVLGREPVGFYAPNDWLESRASSIVDKGNNDAYLVGTDKLGGSFIEMLRNRMTVKAAGARILGGLVGDVSIPKQTGGATAYWVAESGAPTVSYQTAGQLALSPKTIGAFVDISRKLLKQSSIDTEQMVRADLAAVLALGIDLAALHGTGSNNQPTGIAATSGIGSVAGGDNGLAPTWAHIVQLETEVSVDNADIGNLAYMTNAKVRGKLKTTAKASNTASFVWEGGPQPMNGYNAFVSNQVSSALTKGTSSGVCSAIFFGNWADLIIAMWGGLDILVDPFTSSSSAATRVTAFQDIDIGVRHAESFAAMLDALTA